MEVEVSEKPPSGWNDFLLSQTSGNFYQSTFYADYAQAEIGFKPFYFSVVGGGSTVAQLLVFESCKYYGLKFRPGYSVFYPLVKLFFKQLHWVYGPVCSEEKYAVALLDKVKSFSQEKKIKIAGSSAFPLNDFKEVSIQAGFQRENKATFVVDLSLSEEELWKNVDKSARKLVNRTLEDVNVRIIESVEDFKSYCLVLNENRVRSKLAKVPYSEELWRVFSESNSGCFFIAEKDGNVLAGLGVSFFNGFLNEWGAATSSSALEEKIYAGDAIKWEVIKWGRHKGFRFFDLSGVSPEPKTEKEKGIFRFKEKWGGRLVSYGEYSL